MVSNISLTDLVRQHLPSDRKSNTTGFYICCPMCIHIGESRHDTKYRGGFTVNSDLGFIYHCHNCKFSTRWDFSGRVGKNLMFFLTTIGISSKQIPIQLRLLRPNETLDVKIKESKKPDVVMSFDEIRLPSGARSFDSWVEDDEPPMMFIDAFGYMASRGETVFNGSTYYWTPDSSYGMNERVIIPFYHHGKIVGYTCRCFTGNTKLRKYYSEQPTDYMYNQDLLEDDDDSILLVEGILDSIVIDGIGLLGNSLSEKQINLLKWSGKRIILVPDMDKAGEKLLNQAIDNDWEISFPRWDCGITDSAAATKKYGKLYTLETIYNGATNNKTKIELYKTGVYRLRSGKKR